MHSVSADPHVRRTEALVIGCGPAGAAAATLLARAGVQTTVLERGRFPRDKVCGDALSNDAVSILASLGVRSAVLAGPHARVSRARAIFPGGALVTRDYHSPGLIVPRRVLDDALRQGAEAAGARVCEGVSSRGLLAEGGRVVGVATSEGTWRADLVVAADGPGSVARAVLGHPKPAGRLLGVARTVYLEGVREGDASETADHYFEHDLPCGYGWVFPAVEGRANVGVYQRSDLYRAGPGALDAALDRFLERHPERFAGARQAGPRRTWPLPLSPPGWSLGAPGLLAVGDAANLVDPLSGEGIWQALRSGQVAAELALARGLGAGQELARAHTDACAQLITHACARRARVQDALRWFLALRLYRLGPARELLAWGYRRQHFEAAKVL